MSKAAVQMKWMVSSMAVCARNSPAQVAGCMKHKAMKETDALNPPRLT
jgi:hypothetical protein